MTPGGVVSTVRASTSCADAEETVMPGTTHNFAEPSETATFPHGHEDIVVVDGTSIGLATFEPGWRWSNDIKPLMGTDQCPILHRGYLLSGAIHIELRDGATLDILAGDTFVIPPGHDAWVVGDEPAQLLDWGGKVREHARPVGATAEAGR